MEALLEPTASPNQYVGSRRDAPQSLIGQTAPSPFRQGIVRYDHYQIKIAVCSFLTPGMGPEKVDPFRLVGVDESTDDLGEDRRKGLCAGAGCCHGSTWLFPLKYRRLVVVSRKLGRGVRGEVKETALSGVDLPAEMESPLGGGGLDFPGILIANCSGTCWHLLETWVRFY